MWPEFFCAVVLLAALLYLPGSLFLRAFALPRVACAAFAPVVSLAFCIALSVGFASARLAYGWIPAFCCTMVVGILAWAVSLLLRKRRGGTSTCTLFDDWQDTARPARTWQPYALYILVAMVLTLVFFVYPLDGAASFVQDSDNSWHLGVVKSFADSARMSLLQVTLYPDFPADQLALKPTAPSYYPAIWHMLAALLVRALDVPVSLAANATNTVLLMLVFPSAVYAMVRTVLKGIRSAWWLGALFGLAFAAFPWGFLLPASGPLYPSFLGFILVPYAVALFFELIGGDAQRSDRLLACGILLLGLFDMACAHPSSVFTFAVFLFPYCVYRVGTIMTRRHTASPRKMRTAFLACAGFVLAGVLVWTVCYNLPALQSVVRFRWDAFASPQQELVNILTLAFRRESTQIVLGIVVIAGIAYTLYRRKYLWISCSYALACLICFVDATSDGFLKGFLSGFWYTDPYRTGAMAALIAIPLAVLGAKAILIAITKLTDLIATSTPDRAFTRRAIPVIGCAALLLCTYYPDFAVPGAFNVSTGFGDYAYSVKAANAIDRNNLFDQPEMAFTQKVREVVGDAVVYNNADDGSVFAYEFADLSLCYRRSAAELIKDESEASELLRLHIDELATNEAVRQVIDEAKIRYILVLDYGGEALDERCFYGYYTPEKWAGINTITDETPGLETVLSEGDMRLYRIMNGTTEN